MKTKLILALLLLLASLVCRAGDTNEPIVLKIVGDKTMVWISWNSIPGRTYNLFYKVPGISWWQSGRPYVAPETTANWYFTHGSKAPWMLFKVGLVPE